MYAYTYDPETGGILLNDSTPLFSKEPRPVYAREMDILGFDCVDICTMLKPPIPVVCQPEQEIGHTAAAYLIERMQGLTDAPRTTRLECRTALGKNV